MGAGWGLTAEAAGAVDRTGQSSDFASRGHDDCQATACMARHKRNNRLLQLAVAVRSQTWQLQRQRSRLRPC